MRCVGMRRPLRTGVPQRWCTDLMALVADNRVNDASGVFSLFSAAVARQEVLRHARR
jgi:hypothetical protein